MEPQPRVPRLSDFFAEDETACACLQALTRALGQDSSCVCQQPASPQSLNLAGALFVIDVNRRVIFFSQAAAELTGHLPEDVVGRSCKEGLHAITCGSPCPLREHELCGRHVELLAADGRRLQVVKESTLLREEGGAIVGAVVTLRDVSDLGQQSEDLESRISRMESRCRALEMVAEDQGEGVCVLDAAGIITCITERGARLLGLSTESAVGTNLTCALDRSAEVTQAIQRVLSEDGDLVLSALPRVSPGTSPRALVLHLHAVGGHGKPTTGVVIHFVEEEAMPAAFHGIIGRSAAIRDLVRRILVLAASDSTVLITAESGCGKELVARALHAAGPRASRPFHAVNCAALSPQLLESELFGHERGAFTGAFRAKQGRLELCADGTLLLDEIACLPAEVQAKLLRVLENREFERVGGTESITLQARIITATNAGLRALVARGEFREDLYYRLCVVPLEIPPLRSRREDIPLLAAHFARLGGAATFTPAALDILVHHDWPGNVRELRNVLEYALAFRRGLVVDVGDLPPELRGATRRSAWPDGDRERIQAALEEAHYNRERAAQLLGVNRTTLWRRMRRLGIA